MSTATKETKQKKASTKKVEAQTVTLQDIVNAGPNGMMVSLAIANELASQGLVETNSAMMNANGEIATRATQQGIDSLAADTVEANTKDETEMTSAQTAAPVKATAFAIAAVALPAAGVGRGRKGTKYPFDELASGQSFFCAGVEAKSIASTVSSANGRYSEVVEGQVRTNRKGKEVPVTKQIREFVVRTIADGAPWGHPGVSGCAVFRTL